MPSRLSPIAVYCLGLFFLLSANSLFAQAYTIGEVPNPKSATGSGYVSNPDGILKPAAVDSLNHWLEDLERTATAQVAVVVLADITSSSTRDFGQALFEAWGLGQADVDNGLLVLFVRDKRKVNFITGYGLEVVLTDLSCKAIQEEYMLPAFKEGNYSEGMVKGLHATVLILENPAIRNEILSQEAFADGRSWATLPLAGKVYAFVLGAYGLAFLLVWLISHFKARPFRCYKNLAAFKHPALWLPFAVLSIAVSLIAFNGIDGFLLSWAILPPLLALGSLGLRYYYRRAPRNGPETGLAMRRLSKEAEQQFLSKAQQKEDALGSNQYDVWVTAGKEEFLILIYKGHQHYQKCPQCGAKTYQRVFRRRLIMPTTERAGKGQEKYACAHCRHESVRLYPIAKLVRVESSSSERRSRNYGSSGSSYSSSSSNYSSRSYSSGSSSWGGGSSGGGGAESSW